MKALIPIILALHGGGGSGDGFKPMTRLEQAAKEKGYLVVFPDGHGGKFHTWNAGRCCGPAVKKKVDHVAELSAFIDKLVKERNADPKRIYATGLSNGAMMSYRLACDLSDKIAAIAPVAGQGVFTSCKPKRKVPTMHFHGTADPCAPYQGGKGGDCWGKILEKLIGFSVTINPLEVEPVPAFFERWRSIHKVTGAGKETYRKGAASCIAHGAQGEMVLCTIEGGGHTWPGGTQGNVCRRPRSRRCRKYNEVVGPVSDDLDASREMVAFFDRFTL